MLGPHFYFDLIRLARKLRNLLWRCGYLLALLIGWWVVYEKFLPLDEEPRDNPINAHARLAANFAYMFLGFQYLFIFLVTPIYLAGTIIEERDNRTLELLFQTHLTDCEILLGKFGARVVHLMFLMLSSLPLLAIISLWGGIDVETLAVHFLLSLLLILFLGIICLWTSVYIHRLTEAMSMAYVLEFVALYYGGSFVFALFERKNSGQPLLFGSFSDLAFAVPLTLLFTSIIFYFCLRRLRVLRDLKWVRSTEPPPPPPLHLERKRTLRQFRPQRHHRFIDSPLFWKELRHCNLPLDIPVNWMLAPLVCAVFFGGLLPLILALWKNHLDAWRAIQEINPFFFDMGYLNLVGGLFLNHSFTATSAVAWEREQETLDVLLLLPVERREILFAKWIVPWLRNRLMVVVTLAFPLLTMMFSVYSIRASLLWLLLPWPLLLLTNFFGLFLSVVCRRVARANMILMASLLGLLLLHLLFWTDFVRMLQAYEVLLLDVDQARRFDEASWSYTLLLIGLQQGAFLLLALLFARLALWCFNRKQP